MNTMTEPVPVGIWYTDETMNDDPDNVTAANCTLMAIVPEEDAEEYASNLYEEATDANEYWQSVQILTQPITSEWAPTYGNADTTNMDDSVLFYLNRTHGTDFSISYTGGNCTAWEAVGLVNGVRSYLFITNAGAQAPVIGWDRSALVGVYVGDEDDEGSFMEYIGDDTEQLSSPYITAGQISDLVARAIETTGFLPIPSLI